MKNLKKGFSLAELLIALAIISIIAIMGYSITKRNVEKAYNLYIYTGYSAIQSAIADANRRGYDFKDCAGGPNGLYSGDNRCEFIKHIQRLLNVTEDNIDDPDSYYFSSFTTFNNIRYILTSGGNAPEDRMLIKMSVPTTKKKINNNVINSYTFSFIYAPETEGCIIPFTNTYQVGITPSEPDIHPTNHIDLTKRVDLLPFYIDDGKSGKVIQYYKEASNTFEQKEYIRRNYYSFYDAFVRSRKAGNYSLSWPYATINLDTRGNSDANKEPGVMRVANPRKVF